MALVYKDRVKETTTTTGTGTLTLAGAASGYQAFSSVGDGNTCVYGLEASDGGWEVGIGTYTLSGTTLARTTILASSASGSAITLPAGTHNVYVTAESSALRNGFLRNKAESPTTAGVTGEVGTMHVLDISGLTADRDFTLPATAAVGDRVGVMLSVGDATYELLIKPATGDTINGGSAGAEWSRLFITGEVVILRCVTADSAWVVECDERKPSSFRAAISTAADGETAATLTVPTAAGGAWTESWDTEGLFNATTSVFTARRAAKWSFEVLGANKDAITDQNYYSVQVAHNDTVQQVFVQITAAGAAAVYVSGAGSLNMATGDTATYKYRSQEGGIGCAVNSYIVGKEIL